MTDRTADPSAGQPRLNGAYAARVAHLPDPAVTDAIDPTYQPVYFPSHRVRQISRQGADALVGGLQVPEADPANPQATVTTYARLDGLEGTVSAVTFSPEHGFTIAFSGGAFNAARREQVSVMQAADLRATLIDRFDMLIDDMD
jgi:hypothetical protein